MNGALRRYEITIRDLDSDVVIKASDVTAAFHLLRLPSDSPGGWTHVHECHLRGNGEYLNASVLSLLIEGRVEPDSVTYTVPPLP